MPIVRSSKRNNVRIEPAGILYMRDNIFAPMPGYQRAIYDS